MNKTDTNNEVWEFEDLLPVMAEKLDSRTFISELCSGFKLLADPLTGLITSDSLSKNSAILGFDWMTREDAEAMVKEGDLKGNGFLNETEFCILMIRLSPGIMEDAETLLEKALHQELANSST
ncbi:calcium-binding protein KIC-like [Impatiens glandulifera]|uniref:calcium-binding protein KIC-like n=1 Tax=Impatiens glandulifera TaxID=253017 RepID=UPI001FB16B7E|nr:calcium-binding protein KIC-like [Impatiens glandulifera]